MLFKLKEMRRKRDCATSTRVISGRLIHRLREQIQAPNDRPVKHRWSRFSDDQSQLIFSVHDFAVPSEKELPMQKRASADSKMIGTYLKGLICTEHLNSGHSGADTSLF
ncbi:MAG: hypothetical protein K2Z81_17275 [Cyanobacteria bacterium]|nr:hypothetical protein [Cyanobacteriota bacterium]